MADDPAKKEMSNGQGMSRVPGLREQAAEALATAVGHRNAYFALANTPGGVNQEAAALIRKATTAVPTLTRRGSGVYDILNAKSQPLKNYRLVYRADAESRMTAVEVKHGGRWTMHFLRATTPRGVWRGVQRVVANARFLRYARTIPTPVAVLTHGARRVRAPLRVSGPRTLSGTWPAAPAARIDEAALRNQVPLVQLTVKFHGHTAPMKFVRPVFQISAQGVLTGATLMFRRGQLKAEVEYVRAGGDKMRPTRVAVEALTLRQARQAQVEEQQQDDAYDTHDDNFYDDDYDDA